MDDFSGLEYEQGSMSEDDIIIKTNDLLSQFNLPTQITSVRDITASLFVVLYESLFSDRLPGIVRHPVSKEDEISNCQTVIDVLSADIIKDNLSHIRGVDIVEGKIQPINNLLDIFTFLFEYVVKTIESDGPTDTDEDLHSSERLEAAAKERPESPADSEDSEVLGLVDGDRQSGMKSGQKSSSETEWIPPRADSNGKGEASGVATSQLPDPATAGPSAIPPSASVASLVGVPSLESVDPIHEGEQLDRQYEKERTHGAVKIAWEKPSTEEQSGAFDFIGMRPKPSTSAASAVSSDSKSSYHLASEPICDLQPQQAAYLERVSPAATSAAVSDPDAAEQGTLSHSRQDGLDLGPQDLSATEPASSDHEKPRSPGRMRSTMAEVSPRDEMAPERRLPIGDSEMQGSAPRYKDLHRMVQHVTVLTRAAVSSSPLSRQQDQAAELSSRAQINVSDVSQKRVDVPPAEGASRIRAVTPTELIYDDPNPFRAGAERSLLDMESRPETPVVSSERASPLREGLDAKAVLPRKATSARAYIPPNTDYVRPSTSSGVRGGRSPPSSKAVRRYAPSTEVRPSTSGARPKEIRSKKVSTSVEDEVDARLREAVARVQAEAAERITRARCATREVQLSARLREMGKPSLASAQRRLETEDRMFKQKQEFVKSMYQEDLVEAAEEVKGLLTTDHKIMKEKEKEYKKLMALGTTPKKAKAPSKPKGFLLPKTKKSKTLQVSKTPKTKASKINTSCAAGPSKPRQRSLTVGEDADLMPVLLDEFPHMYLSEHTWHEMRRKGLRQIENLTRAYEENKRRKSKAQLQLEEAARKHELMASIIKKQLEHGHRMQQIQEQKRQQVAMANRLQEKRTQSARTRRYYNEYQVRARSKMLKRQTREELVFKNLFKDGLAIQKERIREVRRYAKEQREKQAQRRQDEIDSIENFYKDQFDVLVEKLIRDKAIMTCREKAHQKMLDQMKRDLRNKMEKEIQEIQTQMFRDDDDIHIRQLEADRMRHKLKHARCQTRT